jgi:hypothetical protein
MVRCYGAAVSVRPLAVGAALAWFAASGSAFAQGIPDFYSARAVGFAGARSLASSSEAIWLNPAGLGFTQQYILQADYAHDTAPSSALPAGNGLVVSIVDSKTNPSFPTGLSFRYVWLNVGDTKVQGSVYDFSIAAKLFGQVALGLHLQYLSYTGVQDITGDLGLLVPIGPISFNASGFNLIEVNSPEAPRGFDVGVAAGDGKLFRIGFDYARQWPIHLEPQNVFDLGAEVFIAQMVPIRAGLLWNTQHPKFWPPQYVTAGTGFYISMVGFDVSYRRNLLNGENSFAFAVKIFQ